MSDEWVKASNLVRQQTQIMVNELTSLTERVTNQARSIDILQRERDDALRRLEATPSMIMEATNRDLRRQLREADEKIEQYREYMRLKDNAKIKVEGQRDYHKSRVAEAERTTRIYKDNVHALTEQIRSLEAQNASQARAFEERGRKLLEKDELIRRTSAENGRLLEVIRLGRAGLEGETW